ncbi:DNA-binding protein [Shewanella sp.]|uniref:DNA-binding protein n=1 Tax=Shewanella sp. TaxID=50422 RepID=UPI003A84D7B6
MNKAWFSPQELLQLPGMPTTVQGIRFKAKTESWESRKKEGSKGFEYLLGSLPPITQAHLRQQAVKNTTSREVAAARQVLATPASLVEKKTELQQQFLVLPTSKQQVAMERYQLLTEMANFVEPFIAAGRRTDGVVAFAKQCGQSKATLYRWQKAFEEKGMMGLVDTRGGAQVSVMAEQTELQQFLIALVTGKPHLLTKYKTLQQEAEKKANDLGWTVPSIGAIRRWVQRWHSDNIAAFTALTNPDAYNNSHRPLYGTMYPWISSPNQIWEFDSTPTDVMLNAHGKLRRYAVVAAIDVYTRRPMVLVTPTSNAEGICLLLRRCLLNWGMLEKDGIARTDNGTDYVSQRVAGIFNMLDIDQSRTRPFSGWEKPYIERFFGTLSRALFELLPAYIGHSVSDRQKIESAKAFAQRIGGKNKAANNAEALELAMTPEALQKIIDDWIQYDYMHRVHEGFKDELAGKTPFEVMNESGYIASRVANPHSLDLLLNHVGDATVVRGSVKPGNSVQYTAPELQEAAWDRKRVRVFLDPSDVGRATIYALDDWTQCVDAVNLDLIGRDIDPAEFRKARNEEKKVLASFRRAARELQDKFGIDTLAAEGLAKAAAERGSLTSFTPTPTTTDNPALAALSQVSSDSDRLLASLSRQSQSIGEAAERVNQNHATVMRTEHEKAEELTLATLERELTEREQLWLKEYRLKYRMFAARLDKQLEAVKKAAK